MNVVAINENVLQEDIPAQLRILAEEIENGRRQAAVLAWVTDEGGGLLGTGIFGQVSPRARGTTAHFMFALAQRKIEAI
jgi:hypothetical protein